MSFDFFYIFYAKNVGLLHSPSFASLPSPCPEMPRIIGLPYVLFLLLWEPTDNENIESIEMHRKRCSMDQAVIDPVTDPVSFDT